MNFKNIKNKILGRYSNNKDAVIIACYYNPQRNEYRKKAFDIWYNTVKHLNVKIIEATLENVPFELNENITTKRIVLKEWLWEKEKLLNILIKDCYNYKYIFWLDTDIIFKNKNWLVESCEKLKYCSVIQPFEYCVHLDQDDFTGNKTVLKYNEKIRDLDYIFSGRKMWKSYASNANLDKYTNKPYDIKGHVGFAWGAKVEVLKECNLYEDAKIGGADGIIAYATTSPVINSKVTEMFGITNELIKFTNTWYNSCVKSNMINLDYCKGDLLHIWHGDVKKREYYNRIKEFSKTENKVEYFKNYMNYREDTTVIEEIKNDYLLNIINDVVDNGTDFISESNTNNFEFEGGDFGGAGASGDWTIDENFS